MVFRSLNSDIVFIEISVQVKDTLIRIDYSIQKRGICLAGFADSGSKTSQELRNHDLAAAIRLIVCTETCEVCFEVRCELSSVV